MMRGRFYFLFGIVYVVSSLAYPSFTIASDAANPPPESSPNTPTTSLNGSGSDQTTPTLEPPVSDTQKLFQSNPLQAVNNQQANNFPVPPGGTLAPSNPNFAFYSETAGPAAYSVNLHLINLITGASQSLYAHHYSFHIISEGIQDVSPDGKYVVYSLVDRNVFDVYTLTSYFQSIEDPKNTILTTDTRPVYGSSNFNPVLSFPASNIAQTTIDLIGGLIRKTTTVNLETKEVVSSYELLQSKNFDLQRMWDRKNGLLVVPESHGSSSQVLYVYDTSQGLRAMRLVNDNVVSPPYFGIESAVHNLRLGPKGSRIAGFAYSFTYWNRETGKHRETGTCIVNGITGKYLFLIGTIRDAKARKGLMIYEIKDKKGKVKEIRVNTDTMEIVP